MGGNYLKTVGRAVGVALFLTLAPYSTVEAKPTTEVVKNRWGIQSKVDVRHVQSKWNQYRFRGKLTLDNPKEITLPVSLHSLLCFDYQGQTNCMDWSSEKLPGLPQGSLEREIELEIFTNQIPFEVDGEQVYQSVHDTVPYIKVRVNSVASKLLCAKHFL